jgi:hypothetical protein
MFIGSRTSYFLFLHYSKDFDQMMEDNHKKGKFIEYMIIYWIELCYFTLIIVVTHKLMKSKEEIRRKTVRQGTLNQRKT